MPVDYCFILAAGLGTRMGKIGEYLPKPLWPIYESTLLDMQILFAKKLGIKKIYVNAFHQARAVCQHIEARYGSEVMVLVEDPLLDSGGGIHNFSASCSYNGVALKIDADVFMFFNQEEIFEQARLLREKGGVRLFGMHVAAKGRYNETILENGFLKDIRGPNEMMNYITYSGVGLIDLASLPRVKGPSRFFSSVANYQQREIDFIMPGQYEYWDFGTSQNYYKEVIKLAKKLREGSPGLLPDFLRDHKLFCPEHLGPDGGYRCVGGGLNFGRTERMNLEKGQILFSGNSPGKYRLQWNSIGQNE